MKPLATTGFALLGAALVAISYGLARFAFGLFVPPIRAELELAPDVVGIIGALAFISFVLATLLAPIAAHRLGARNTAVLSGAFGVGGLAYMSLTGLYLISGIRLLPGRLSLGPVLPFIACAVGQAAGSPVVGLVVKEYGYADAFAFFSAIGILVAGLSPLYPRHLDDGEGDEEETGLQAALVQAALDHQSEGVPDEPLQPATEQAATS